MVLVSFSYYGKVHIDESGAVVWTVRESLVRIRYGWGKYLRNFFTYLGFACGSDYPNWINWMIWNLKLVNEVYGIDSIYNSTIYNMTFSIWN